MKTRFTFSFFTFEVLKVSYTRPCVHVASFCCRERTFTSITRNGVNGKRKVSLSNTST